MKKLKSFVSILITILLLTLSFSTVYAAEKKSGTCGPNATWTFENGVVTVSGNGVIYNYDNDYSYSPFVKFNDDITKIVIKSGITHIGNYSFWCCSNLQELKLPDTLISIGDGSFYSCMNLKSVTIPDKVKTIGYEAFRCCTSLKRLTLGNSVEIIGNSAFSTYTKIETLIIPDSVKTIDISAFNLATNLKKVVIGNGVKNIEYGAFSSCQSMETLVIGNNVETIGNNAFYSCNSLKSLTIPNSVKSIGNKAFYQCSSITSLNIPDSVTSVGVGAFEYCTNLKNITIGTGLTNITTRVFEGCHTLQSALILENIVEISDSAFEWCHNVKIKCYSNSYAEEYAKMLGLKIEYMDGKFIDVPDDAWYNEAVRFCTDNSFMVGTGNHKYNPDAVLTREQFVVILARVAGADLTQYNDIEFIDVDPSSWYGPSVIWGAENGYVKGIGNSKFGVGKNIDRQSLATLFYRYAINEGINVSLKADLSEYTDFDTISDWALESCEWAVGAKLINSTSTSQKTLSPEMKVSRSQAAQIFMNYNLNVLNEPSE